MKYTIKKEAMESMAKKLATVTSAKCIGIKPIAIKGKQHLKLAACNDSMQIETYIACECDEEATTTETIYVSESFLNICKTIVSDKLTIDLHKKSLTMKVQGANLELSFLENCNLLVADIQEIDDIKEHPTQQDYLYKYSVAGSTFIAALSIFGGVTAGGTNLPFTGPCVEVLDQYIKVTSTNGYALSSGKIPCLSTEKNTENCSDMLPCEVGKALTACDLSSDINITITVQEHFMYVNADNSLLLFRLSKTQFPKMDIEKMFSTPVECKCKVDTKAFANAIRLIELATPEKAKSNGTTSIEMHFSGEGLQLKSEASTVTVPASEIEGDGGKTIMSGKLLSQIIGIMPSSTVIELKDKSSNGAILLNGYAYVMPIKK